MTEEQQQLVYHNATERLRLAVNQLRKSERGQRVLTALVVAYDVGGSGLDDSNKRAFEELIDCMLHHPWHWPAELHGKV